MDVTQASWGASPFRFKLKGLFSWDLNVLGLGFRVKGSVSSRSRGFRVWVWVCSHSKEMLLLDEGDSESWGALKPTPSAPKS